MNMDWNVYIESLGPEPGAPVLDVEAVQQAGEERRAAAAAQDAAARDARDLGVLRSYEAAGLPLNRKKLPKSKPLNELAGYTIRRADVRRLWPER